ncbi:MAG: hypothetical protein HQ508_06850 [Candidatus Marinimicrobia bacterium]|nr:hypothetical protein [Candidatus Neomarinimicrobiota bacterium]
MGSFVSADTIKHTVSKSREHPASRYEWQIIIPGTHDIILNGSGIEFPGWTTTIQNDGYCLPVKTKLIYTLGGPPDVEIDIGNQYSVIIPEGIPAAIDQAKGLQISAAPDVNFTPERVKLKLIGVEDGYELWAVTVFGALPDASINQFLIPDHLQVTITSAELNTSNSLAGDLYLNQIRPGNTDLLRMNQTGLGMGKLKILLIQDGLYRIYYDSLEHIDGFPTDIIQSSTIQLALKGEQQPIYVFDHGDGQFGSGDYFDFIGKQNYFTGESQYFDPFSDLSVYWLDWGASEGLRFVEESGALLAPDPVRPHTFWDNVHIEEDNDFERLGQVDTDKPSITRDHYFWTSVNSGATKEVDFTLANPFRGSSENVEISVGLHGLTYSQTTGDEAGHTLFAILNDNSIGSASWTQQEEYVLTSPAALNLSHNLLSQNGNNTLGIFAPVSTAPGNYDKIVLNWIKIGYEHLLIADQDALRFRKSFINPSTNIEFEINNFSSHDLVLYKEGLSKITGFNIRENWDAELPKYSLVFQDQVSDATPDYWASGVASLFQPVKMVMDTSVSLRNLDGNFIVITIPEYSQGLDEYLAYKQDEGWDPVSISIGDIYDEFNYGTNSPFAIKSFLKYAHNNWPSHPEYVLLIGDAISNPQQAKRDFRLNNIPTFYMQTYGWGAAEADYWYSLINGDDFIPDINIGRIPCSNTEDLETTLSKLIRYGSQENYGAWQNEMITIAGFDTTFKIQSESLLLNAIPRSIMPSRIFIDRDSEGQIFWGDTDSLISHWNAGKILINFLGHGGGAVWADRSLFVRDDINYLDSETPPAFVTSMTCFTASFALTRGLGEVVLTESPAGAIGWFGSSGVGWIINDYLMIQPMLKRLLEDNKTVGEIINLARMEYFLANSGYDYLKPSMLFQYNFLGDPTTRLALPDHQELLFSDKPIYLPNEQVRLHYSGVENGLLKLLPLNSEGHPWWSEPQTFDTEQIQDYLFDLEAEVPEGLGRSIYTLDRGPNLAAIQGFTSYSVSTDWFEHQLPTREELANYTQLPIRVRFHSNTQTADSLVLILSGSNTGRTMMDHNDGWWTVPEDFELTTQSGITDYSFSAFSQGLHIQNSPTFRLYLPEAILLSVNDIRLGTEGNRCGVLIDYSLFGIGETLATLNFHELSLSYVQDMVKPVTLRKGDNYLFVPSFFGLDSVNLIVSIEFNGDLDTSDNSMHVQLLPQYLQVLPGIGFSFDGISSTSIPLWSNGNIVAISMDTCWVKLLSYDEIIASLPGVTLYQDSSTYMIESSIGEVNFEVESEKQLFFKDMGLPLWQILPKVETSYDLKGSGIIAMGQKMNFTGPDVSMMVEGQLFFNGDYIIENSRINILAEDENGFSWRNEDISILVDGASAVPHLGDTTDTGRLISISAQLELGVGEHYISYQVSDALGNWSEPEAVAAVVAGEAEIIDYGNFPNPFEGETLLIYELTQPLEDVAIDIFTLSGFKLYTIDAFNARVSISLGAIGYHEVPWNGRDRNDDFVANGVYFYRIKGEVDGEDLVGPVGKMVKNR